MIVPPYTCTYAITYIMSILPLVVYVLMKVEHKLCPLKLSLMEGVHIFCVAGGVDQVGLEGYPRHPYTHGGSQPAALCDS